MKKDLAFLKSKVALRISILFIICAIVPMTILAVISFFQINRQLDMNARDRLHKDAISRSTLIFERLILVDAELEMFMAHLDEHFSGQMDIQYAERHEPLRNRYTSLSLVAEDGRLIAELLGHIPEAFLRDKEQLADLFSERFLVFTSKYDQQSASLIFVCMKTTLSDGADAVLLAEIKPEYLLGLSQEEIMYDQVKISIIEGDRIIYSSISRDCDDSLLNRLPPLPMRAGSFKWDYGGKTFVSSCAQVFIKSRFHGPVWTLVLSQWEEYIHVPMARYRLSFILLFFIAILSVLFLSTNQIRKSLMPLFRLKEITRNISRGDFTSRIEVEGSDEFSVLAESFNTMTEKLDYQFKTLRTMASIDHAILSVLDTEKIVDTFISRAGDVLPCDSVSICLLDSQTDDTWHNYTKDFVHPGKKISKAMQIPGGELGQLYQNREYMILDYKHAIPSYLTTMSTQGIRSFLVLPILLKDKISAIVSLGNWEQTDYSKDFLMQARQIVDRIAVALSNTDLVEDLNRLNWGTLQTLARVVDAKSHWTAGHSERVADIAVKIGVAMGLSVREIDALKKTGLLHDIGKISTPKVLLDNPASLTDEEFKIIQEHPVNGAGILEPITPYREIIPGVLQHHERFDGKGYPDGISGREIALYARIIAVADTFDAMISDRPYREGKSLPFVIRAIKQEAGHQFDPKVVAAFLSVITQESFMEVRA